MKNNVIQIIKIMGFVTLSFILFLFISSMKKPLNYNLANVAGFYGEKQDSLDMVYIGGSACFVYWQPLKAWKDKGIVSYDFAADTIQPEFYKYLIKEVLQNQSPEVIVVDARAFQYRDVDQPPTEVAYRNFLTGTPLSLNRFDFIENNVKKYLKEDTLSYHFDLIKYHGTGINSINDTLKIMMENYDNQLKGFYFVPKVAKMEKQTFETDKKTPMSGETNKILEDLLKYLKTIDQKVLFVVSPYIETEKQKENFNYIEEKIVAAGYDFIDTNEYYKDMNINFDTDFYNYGHMNIYGSEKYTFFLESYLIEKYGLKDRRNDNSYKEDWNNLLENWDTKVNNTKNTINNLIESGN